MRHLPGSPDTQPHLIRRHKTEAFVQPPTIIRGVKDDAPDAANGEGIEERAHQCVADAAPPPGGLYVDVEDDASGPSSRWSPSAPGRGRIGLSCTPAPPMTAGRAPCVFGDPGQILATRQGIAQVRGGCLLQCFLVVSEQSPHIPKHRRAMVCEERDVGRVSLAHGEHWLRARHGWIRRC